MAKQDNAQKLIDTTNEIDRLNELMTEAGLTQAQEDSILAELYDLGRLAEELRRKIARAAKSRAYSRARSEAMKSIGMKRTAYGWE